MKELAKIFGISSIILLSISLTGPGSEFLWGTLKPLSTLLLIAFFITNFLAEEYANYDEKQNYRTRVGALLLVSARGETPACAEMS